ncbi:hypothetical protein evm_012855 [Chilo suppressalis]|nr:hypothetical protein evm_012855 [Chilo suppressalis]
MHEAPVIACEFFRKQDILVTKSIRPNHATDNLHQCCEAAPLRVLFSKRNQGAYELTIHSIVCGHSRPQTPATPEISQLRCRPLRNELFKRTF